MLMPYVPFTGSVVETELILVNLIEQPGVSILLRGGRFVNVRLADFERSGSGGGTVSASFCSLSSSFLDSSYYHLSYNQLYFNSFCFYSSSFCFYSRVLFLFQVMKHCFLTISKMRFFVSFLTQVAFRQIYSTACPRFLLSRSGF